MGFLGQPVYNESVSAVTATPSVVLGSRRVDTAGNEYVYGYNAGAATAEVGFGVVNGSSNAGYSFTVTNAASQTGWLVGVVHHSTIPAGSYGWVGVRGAFRAIPDGTATSMAAGVQLALGIDGGFVSKAAATAVGGTFLAGWGLTISSIVTGHSNASFTSAGLDSYGKAWFRTMWG